MYKLQVVIHKICSTLLVDMITLQVIVVIIKTRSRNVLIELSIKTIAN
jgi:hypothetical protein